VTPTTNRESLYVAMTRGRDANTAWVATDRPDQAHDAPHPSDAEERTARDVLVSVLANSRAELSAHQIIAAEAEVWLNTTQLGAEYETLAAATMQDRWASLIRSSLPEFQAEVVLRSEAFGPLAAGLHRAVAVGWNPEAEFPRLVAARSLGDADDVAAVLHGRLARVLDQVESRPRRNQPTYILGMYAEATDPASPAMQAALAERRTALETRAGDLLRRAVAGGAPWLTAIGPQPAGQAGARRWTRAALAVAAYRDRHQIETSTPFGTPTTLVQRRDAARIRAMLAQPRQRPAEQAPTVKRAQGPTLR
jgi:hypothetical protein